jgi:hypothetical protein
LLQSSERNPIPSKLESTTTLSWPISNIYNIHYIAN